ncbi:MAG TPA: hypothetical protein VK874_01760 [Gaiellaceae bacterium]|nr:hypothetical protein [Gaiellaceae bacterium]
MRASLGRDVVALACATSAGIHGALVPAHLAEGAAAGVAFAAAAGALALIAVAVTRRPASDLPLAVAALALAGLIASYLLAVTSGLPLLHPEPEPVDGLALATKAIEALGLAAACALLGARAATHSTHPATKGT